MQLLAFLPDKNNSQFIWLLFLCLICTGCQQNCCNFEPIICYSPPPCYIESLPSPFSPLTPVERSKDWGKELFLGRSFAKEMDLYRALTCFKSALYLIPRTHER